MRDTCIAFLNSSYSIAPIFGFGLAAVTTMQPESLFGIVTTYLLLIVIDVFCS